MGPAKSSSEPVVVDVCPGGMVAGRLVCGCNDPAAAMAVVSATASRIIVVSDERVAGLYPWFVESLRDLATPVVSQFVFPSGERGKTMETVSACCSFAAGQGADRQALVVGFGGGVVTDIAGMVAGLWMRGVRLINVPTSLVAMADAAVGGKAAVNILEGRNLLGLFKHPEYVFEHAPFLKTLDRAEVVNGLVEIIKTAAVGDQSLLAAVEEGAGLEDYEWLGELAFRAASVKVGVVNQDPEDRGVRQLLNFGHTVGHAVEVATDFGISHGLAVAFGISVESAIAVRAGIMDSAHRRRLLDVLAKVGVPSRPSLNPEVLFDLMLRDKKNAGGNVRISVPGNTCLIPASSGFETLAVSRGLFMESFND